MRKNQTINLTILHIKVLFDRIIPLSGGTLVTSGLMKRTQLERRWFCQRVILHLISMGTLMKVKSRQNKVKTTMKMILSRKVYINQK